MPKPTKIRIASIRGNRPDPRERIRPGTDYFFLAGAAAGAAAAFFSMAACTSVFTAVMRARMALAFSLAPMKSPPSISGCTS